MLNIDSQHNQHTTIAGRPSVRDAFGHLKAIAANKGGQMLLKTANIGQDAGVVDASDKDAFIAAAKTRQWDREKSVRTLA
jgi:catalase